MAPAGPRATALALSAALVLVGGAAAQEGGLEYYGFALGDADAPVTVVEYADFACSACAEFSRDTWPTLRTRYVETGRVRWWIVPFELGFRNSDEGARAARCGAEQRAFWALHDVLFSQRERWVGERRPRDALVALAAEAGLDADAFRTCYEDDRGHERTEAANDAARDAGIRGTPTFLVDDFRVQGAIPLATFVELLERGGG